jgi:hypothetical protein
VTRLAVPFLFILVYSSSNGVTRAPKSLAPEAIKIVIDKFHTKNVQEIEVINFGVRNGRAQEMIDKLLMQCNHLVTLKISRDKRKHPESDEFKLNEPSILIFDSPENFNRTQRGIIFQHGNLVSHPHIVYIHNATIKDIQVVGYKNHTIDKTIFLVNETLHSIELATSFLVTPKACWTNQFRVINRYTRQEKRWEENTKFFVEKYSNFYKCILENRFDYRKFQKELNFTLKVRGTTVLLNESISFMMIHLPHSMLGTPNLYVMQTIPKKILLPPGEVYSDFEKMFLPFDSSTWIAILLTIILGLFSIVVIKLMPRSFQNVIFGEDNRSPLMNFIDILLNGGQYRNLVGNAPRIFLMSAILWSLIFR